MGHDLCIPCFNASTCSYLVQRYYNSKQNHRVQHQSWDWAKFKSAALQPAPPFVFGHSYTLKDNIRLTMGRTKTRQPMPVPSQFMLFPSYMVRTMLKKKSRNCQVRQQFFSHYPVLLYALWLKDKKSKTNLVRSSANILSPPYPTLSNNDASDWKPRVDRSRRLCYFQRPNSKVMPDFWTHKKENFAFNIWSCFSYCG